MLQLERNRDYEYIELLKNFDRKNLTIFSILEMKPDFGVYLKSLFILDTYNKKFLFKK